MQTGLLIGWEKAQFKDEQISKFMHESSEKYVHARTKSVDSWTISQ